ncbi:hypothetical protein, partial [Phocaeicola plebeius]|uniref:hypothetical protein n=1 Tax=Phocaeicola plebeius TaxID=310297 RepID=UPI0040261963
FRSDTEDGSCWGLSLCAFGEMGVGSFCCCILCSVFLFWGFLWGEIASELRSFFGSFTRYSLW